MGKRISEEERICRNLEKERKSNLRKIVIEESLREDKGEYEGRKTGTPRKTGDCL